jgi:hypothetical protein
MLRLRLQKKFVAGAPPQPLMPAGGWIYAGFACALDTTYSILTTRLPSTLRGVLDSRVLASTPPRRRAW